jgi:ATP phosphoribosyltransferase regulatory subunit HisZ
LPMYFLRGSSHRRVWHVVPRHVLHGYELSCLLRLNTWSPAHRNRRVIFKRSLVDQLSGHNSGLRADTTPQVARIDAHLLNREGVARLCCGPVLHNAERPHATREPLQFGAEIAAMRV